MKVVISGGTGAIGMALIKELIAGGHTVYVLVRPDSARKERLKSIKGVNLVEADLTDYSTRMSEIADEIGKDVSVFYHLAWNGTIGDCRNDCYLQNQNVRFTLDAVRLAKALGAETFIGAGSQAEYGRVEGVLTASTATNPENGYGMAKLCAGYMSRLLCEQLALKHIWVRVLSVFGPYDSEKTMVVSCLRKMLNGEKAKFTKGEQKWDYLFSADAARAFARLGEMSLLGDALNNKVYCLGSGQAKALKEYIGIMHNLSKCSQKLLLGEIPYGSRQVMFLQADISELEKDIGFEPKTSFEDGINETIKWIRNEV